jgi:hypothetical protein
LGCACFAYGQRWASPGESNPPIPRVDRTTRVHLIPQKKSPKRRNYKLLLPAHGAAAQLALSSPPRTRIAPPVSHDGRRRTPGVAGEPRRRHRRRIINPSPMQCLIPAPRPCISLHARQHRSSVSHDHRRRTPMQRRRCSSASTFAATMLTPCSTTTHPR